MFISYQNLTNILPFLRSCCIHYNDVIMGSMAPQITSLTIVYSAVDSGADQRKHQSSASLAFARGIHWSPVNSPHKWPVTRKKFPFDDVIMYNTLLHRVAIYKESKLLFRPQVLITTDSCHVHREIARTMPILRRYSKAKLNDDQVKTMGSVLDRYTE